MKRGTTPTFSLSLDGIDFSLLDTIYVTFKQDNNIITKSNTDITLDEQNKLINLALTQKETLSFRQGYVYIQLRAVTKGGNAVATDIVRIDANGILKEEII